MFVIMGEVRELERKQGTSMRRDYSTGEEKPEAYDYLVAYVLTGRDVLACRVEPDYPPLTEGELISAECRVTPYKRSGEPALAVRLLRPAPAKLA